MYADKTRGKYSLTDLFQPILIRRIQIILSNQYLLSKNLFYKSFSIFLSAKLGFGPAFAESLDLTFFSFSILVEVNEVEVSWLSQRVMWLLWLCKQVYLYKDERLCFIKVQTVQMWQPNRNSRKLCCTVFLYSTVQTVHCTKT